MTALSFAKVDYKMNRNERNPFSITNYKRRIHNEKLLKLFIFKFDLDLEVAINQNDIWNYRITVLYVLKYFHCIDHRKVRLLIPVKSSHIYPQHNHTKNTT